MNLLAISGSLRRQSSNNVVIETVRDLAAAAGHPTFELADIGALPHFNQDLDGEDADPIAPVEALRAAVRRADALLFVSPEYAHGVPGVLRNAIEWLVSSGALGDKPTAVITASPHPGGGSYAQAQLRETLSMLTGALVEEACREIDAIGPKIDRARKRITDERTLETLRTTLTGLRAATR
ncbi:NADPH-dependent FMN reductase [Streptomyces varsoviensis]|uniref:Nadph-dependent fmn reductase n=1 Tax=Streptomyces varsoviensis TaxID=67373 RepID=A0ABR5IVP4_9ACTN|nr:NADPH-dependent FMN reductase [Streptomyces varsoviensis]KOG85225.1 nadph-dependent fmn reductase [Streptomyces varsoviensis]